MSAPMRFPFILVAAALFFALLPSPARATIFTFVDAKGVIHFSNVPTDTRYRPLFGEEKKKRSLDRFIHRAAQASDVDPLLIKAVIQAESNFDHLAVSRRGAKGLMQLMPEAISDMQVQNPFDPEDNITGGTRYLRLMLDIFEGDLPLAIAAYNAGPERVRKLGRIPHIPETEGYVKKVLATYKRLQDNPSLALY